MSFEMERNIWKFYDNMIRVMEYVIMPILVEKGLNLSQLSIMYAIDDHDVLSVSELSDKTRMNLGNCSSTCKHLEKLGWINRERCKSDERRVEVQLTQKGKDLFEEINIEMNKKYREILIDYSKEETDTLLDAYEVMNCFMEKFYLKCDAEKCCK